ncbi:Type 1 glutamine amidotransferase-like domain-containing protein [Sphingomicrobium sp. XHP0239]|uniref:Type 1 glutamine amidotransferase-like domain-containing protein n=1 Tax=Sphingomicrobium maritimum TaxID=3133972 RepID=UPI0031CCAE53
MKAYLSSHGLGPGIGALREIAGGNRTAIIVNALDHFPSAERKRIVNDVIGIEPLFAGAGLLPKIIDLRESFETRSFGNFADEFDIVWLTGGNCFVLQRALVHSGMDRYLIDAVRDERIVYAGWSAGACVAGTSLRGLYQVDDPDIVPQGYPTFPAPESGLGFIEGTILPHFDSAHPESDDIGRAFKQLKREGAVVTCLRDGEALLIANENVRHISTERAA